MQLHVVGAAGSQPGGGQPCSGYIVRTADTTVLVDAGFGVATALTGVMDPRDLDAIVITHRHLDHCVDLLGLLAVLRGGDRIVPLHAAAQVRETVGELLSADSRRELDRVLPTALVQPGDRWELGDLRFEAFAGDHPVPTVALRITDGEGAVLAFSADSGGGEELVACARGADAFLVEATWQVDDDDRYGEGHMTAAAAAGVGRRAGVGHLLLTHLRPHLDPAASLTEAAGVFAGPIDVVRAGDVIEVTRG